MDWKSWVVSMAIGLQLIGCAADGNGDNNPAPETTGKPEVAIPSQVDDSLVPKAVPMRRECTEQAECPEGLVCVAHGRRDLRCEHFEPAPPRTDAEGRPVPPVGLLDGTAEAADIAAMVGGVK